MGRSSTFFEQVSDLTLLAMLLDRIVQVTDDKIDVEELLEKAEICFLDQIGYDSTHSQERLEHLIAENQSLDIQSMSQIARAYALRCQGGPIYKCLDIYAKIKTARSIDEDTMEFLFWLRMAGSPIMVK